MSRYSHLLGAMPRLTELILQKKVELNSRENFPGKKFYVAESLDLFDQETLDILNNFNLGLKTFRYFRLQKGNLHAVLPHSDSVTNPCFALNLMLQGTLVIDFYNSPGSTRIDTGPNDVQFKVLNDCNVRPDESVFHYSNYMRILDTFTMHGARTNESKGDILLISFIPVPQYSFQQACKILNK